MGCSFQRLENSLGACDTRSPMLVHLGPKGLHCEKGGFHVDPARGVERALITHAHSDHARGGSKEYLCAAPGAGLLAARLGSRARIRGVPYGERIRLGDVIVSFHPAGHVLGSAQIRMESEGEVWVATGDFKRDHDLSCAPFELIPCDTFITEATFGDPSYEWDNPEGVCRSIFDWWEEVRADGATAVLFCYALGKAQRILAELTRFTKRPVLVAPEIERLNYCYREEGVALLPTRDVASCSVESFRGELLVTTPHFFQDRSGSALAGLGRIQTAFASGWAKTGRFGSRTYHRTFALSDHADWPSLLRTVEETGARSVYVLGDSSERLSQTLRKKGVYASRMLPDSERHRGSSCEMTVQGELFGNLSRS
ncbi:MAG: DNA ligase-associated DEXH box helicase [Bdellovibrionales bacterium GWB1_55_8]|nr:MAG: DNA ligase-associated DEXH box helicase [Bdellovibrionales bacterium GWB1_55_8]